MLDIKNKSKVHVHWKVSPYDYSKDKEGVIIEKISNKYGIPKSSVKVIQDIIMKNDEGNDISINSDIIQNIQDPQFQLKLFSDYIKLNNITDYDFDLIKKIDSEINQKIDYQIYDKYKRYSVKWIKWSNFLSYGEDNFFDFTKLGKISLLSSMPSNQGGKTTFCIDLLRFLLFGSTTKYKTQNKFFNKHIPSATSVVVEGCINIDGVDYIIKRTLSRPQLGKRTATSKTSQKVEYYKIIGNSKQELEEYIENKEEENSAQTNKVIKEAIGKESDFELIMCVTGKSLDELVDKKETERGRLLARWIGLLPIEEKDVLAREKYNSEIKPFLLSNQYNTEVLSNEIEAFDVVNKNLKNDIKKYKKEIKDLEKEISTMEKTKEVLLQSKKVIDQNLVKIDITTLNRKIDDSIVEGKNKKKEIDNIDDELAKIGNVEFSVEEYDNIQSSLVKVTGERSVVGEQYKNVKANIQHLKTSEICPTCGRKLDNVDNSKKIKELEEELSRIEKIGKEKKSEIEKFEKKIESLKEAREKYNKKSQLTMKKSALELNVEKLRNEYRENAALKKEYELNSEAIDKNNAIDIEIRNNDVLLNNKRTIRENNISYISRNESEIKSNEDKVSERKELIKKMEEEEKLVKNWKIYLEMVGKNGISKMVLRKALPVINARLSQLLFDVCDFNVEVVIDGKNDVLFYLVKDGVYSDLSGGSGFELTASALALRAVLAEMSTIPRMNILVLDEVFGRVAKENYDNIKNLLDKIGKNYDTLINITHLDEFKDYCDSHIIVKKEDNVSTIYLENGKNNSLQLAS